MIFQSLDLKGRQFLELCNNDNNSIELFYVKEDVWLKFFGYSNSLCVRVTRAIMNHASIGEYRLKFFPHEDFSCPCGIYPIETR